MIILSVSITFKTVFVILYTLTPLIPLKGTKCFKQRVEKRSRGNIKNFKPLQTILEASLKKDVGIFGAASIVIGE